MKFTLYNISAVCAFLSVVTTIGIHSFLKGPSSFEEGLLVYKTGYYIFSKYWVIFHCVFVVISIYGLSHYLNEAKRPIANLGFTFYAAFGFFEITRMCMVLHYLSQLRDQYIGTNDEVLKQIIRLSIDNINGIGNTLFVAFTISIILGNLFVGLACLSYQKSIHYLGLCFIIWAVLLTVSLTNEYLNVNWINQFMGYVSILFQPFIRAFLGFILIKLSKE